MTAKSEPTSSRLPLGALRPLPSPTRRQVSAAVAIVATVMADRDDEKIPVRALCGEFYRKSTPLALAFVAAQLGLHTRDGLAVLRQIGIDALSEVS